MYLYLLTIILFLGLGVITITKPQTRKIWQNSLGQKRAKNKKLCWERKSTLYTGAIA